MNPRSDSDLLDRVQGRKAASHGGIVDCELAVLPLTGSVQPIKCRPGACIRRSYHIRSQAGISRCVRGSAQPSRKRQSSA